MQNRKNVESQNDAMITLGLPRETDGIDDFETLTSLDDRVVWLTDDINESSLTIVKTIIRANREDKGKPIEERKPIRLMIYSGGGSLEVMQSLVDVIELSKTPVIGINIGLAASAACIVYLACHKRYALKRSTFMVHLGTGDFSGTYGEVVPAVTTYAGHVRDMGNYIAGKMEIDVNELVKRMWSDWYISAPESVQYHMTDKIVESIDEIL